MNNNAIIIYKDLVLVKKCIEKGDVGMADQFLHDAMWGLWDDMPDEHREEADKFAEEVLGEEL